MKEYNIKLTAEQLQAVINALSERPLKESYITYVSVARQKHEQDSSDKKD